MDIGADVGLGMVVITKERVERMGLYRCIVSGIGAGQVIVAYLPLFGDDGGHIPCVCELIP